MFRQGAPRFIARAVALSKPIAGAKRCRLFAPIPELTGRAKEVYINHSTQETYDNYSDKGSETVHGRSQPPLSKVSLPFSHSPDHDVESIFWVLLYALMLALPRSSCDIPSELFYEGINTIKNHTINQGRVVDVRDWFFQLEEAEWKELFHDKLSCCAGMMMALAEQVYPEYGLLDPPPKKDHLHEAFRRILLNQILTMQDEIPLTPGASRNTSPHPTTMTPTSQTTTSPLTRPSSHVPQKRKATGDLYPESQVRAIGGVPSFMLHGGRYGYWN